MQANTLAGLAGSKLTGMLAIWPAAGAGSEPKLAAEVGGPGNKPATAVSPALRKPAA